MKAICRLLSLGILCVSLSMAGQVERHRVSTVALILRFEEDESLAWLEAVTHGLEQIIEPTGVEFDPRFHNQLTTGQISENWWWCGSKAGARPIARHALSKAVLWAPPRSPMVSSCRSSRWTANRV